MPASNLIERAAELVEQGRGMLAPAMTDELDELARRLREPVRIAIVGRISSGKSTMVNALLGQRIAPTDVSECTRLVTWFRYGHPQRLEIERDDGTRIDAQLAPDGTLPREIGVPVESVRALHCYLANDMLKWMTLIDTPGIGSVHQQYSASTEVLLAAKAASTASSQRADAVVFLFSQVVMADELELLQVFKSAAGKDGGSSAANAVGVLSKADQLGDGTRDPWGVALELADTYAGKFRDEVATVVPVIGLIAEASESATLTEAHATQLAQLAGLEPEQRSRLMWSADRFVTADAPVSAPAREELLQLLDLYGLQRAMSLVEGGASGAMDLRRELSKLSGVSDVKRSLTRYFADQDHVLKVRSVLDTLGRLTYHHEAGPGAVEYRSAVEAVLLDPLMHPVVELEALHECRAGRVTFDPPVQAEVTRLFGPGTAEAKAGVPGEGAAAVAAAAKDRMIWWRRFMVDEADPAQARIARVVLRSYQMLWKDAQ